MYYTGTVSYKVVTMRVLKDGFGLIAQQTNSAVLIKKRLHCVFKFVCVLLFTI